MAKIISGTKECKPGMKLHSVMVNKKILKILGHTLTVSSRSFGRRTLVLQPLMIYIIYWWGEHVFMRPVAMKAPMCEKAMNNHIVPGFLINVKGS